MKKIIYLMRHGQYGYDGGLNDSGREEIIKSGNELKSRINNLKLVKVYHSPILRAKESAEVLQEALKPIDVELFESNDLACDTYKVSNVVEKVDGFGIIISHKPDLEDYVIRRHKDYKLFDNAQFHGFEIW